MSSITIKQFVELLLDTKVKEALAWIEGFKADDSAQKWEDYRDYPLNHGAVLMIASGVHTQLGRQLRAMDRGDPRRQEIREHAYAFFKEIYAKAIESGIQVVLRDIDYSVGGD